MPAHVECFVRNVTAPNVTLHQCALGRSPGEVRMFTPAGNSGHTHVDQRQGERSRCGRWTSIGFKDVDFIKIDAEGYELQILRGAIETLQRCRPTLIVEQKPYNGRRYGPEGDHGALTYLKRLGAEIVAKKGRRLCAGVAVRQRDLIANAEAAAIRLAPLRERFADRQARVYASGPSLPSAPAGMAARWSVDRGQRCMAAGADGGCPVRDRCEMVGAPGWRPRVRWRQGRLGEVRGRRGHHLPAGLGRFGLRPPARMGQAWR